MQLNVTGQVVLPTPGYTTSIQMGTMDRMYPPSLRLRLSVHAPQTDKMVLQALTTKKILFEMTTPILNFRSVAIYCGDLELITIHNVVLTK